jgi:glutamine synthetase
MAISFMAKFNEREGSSCHIHLSIADDAGPLFPRERQVFESFLAGQVACLRDLTLLLAPNVNSYKRYAAGSFAPTAVAWAHDNRTCWLRPEPVPGAERDHRGGPARGRGGARAGAGVRRQRVPGDGQAAAAGDAARRT